MLIIVIGGNVEFHFDRQGVCAFPSNFPSSSALVFSSLAPSVSPLPVTLPSTMHPSPTHAQCAFVLDVKQALNRLATSLSPLPPSSVTSQQQVPSSVIPSQLMQDSLGSWMMVLIAYIISLMCSIFDVSSLPFPSPFPHFPVLLC
jgi:hypothetical protein